MTDKGSGSNIVKGVWKANVIDKEPTIKDMARLWQLCVDFVEENQISSAETVYHSGRVTDNSYNFIARICDEVGYIEHEEDE